MVAVTELVDRLGMIKFLDAAIGPIKSRDRGHTGGQVLVGLAAAQLAGEDFLVGLDRQRADVAGQLLAPVPGLCATTAAGLARKFTDGQWRAVETGVGDIAAAALARLPAARAKEEFVDGVVWVTVGEDAAGPELADKLANVVGLLGSSRPALTDPLAAGAELGRVLGARVLLVIDDVWNAAQVEPFLVGGSSPGPTRPCHRPLLNPKHTRTLSTPGECLHHVLRWR